MRLFQVFSILTQTLSELYFAPNLCKTKQLLHKKNAKPQIICIFLMQKYYICNIKLYRAWNDYTKNLTC